LRHLRLTPWGTQYDNPNAVGFQTAPFTNTRTASNPLTGVWEVTVEASRSAAVTPSTFDLIGVLMGVSVDPALWTVDPAIVGTAYSQLYTFTNLFGAVTAGAVGGTLRSAFSATPTIASGDAPQVTFVNVPAGTTNIAASIGGASDPAADLDLFLFDCHTGTCVQKASSAGSSAVESVSFNSPAAGLWAVLVDPYAIPSGSTTYDYVDSFANAVFGAVSVTDPPALHAAGSSWSATASVTPLQVPDAGRFLLGSVQVKSGSTLLGQGQVRLENVQ